VFFFDVYRSLFFFQAEDGIRDRNVTGVQTCALPIYGHVVAGQPSTPHERRDAGTSGAWGGTRGTRGPLPCAPAVHGGDGRPCGEIGRASCRERVEVEGGRGFGTDKRGTA